MFFFFSHSSYFALILLIKEKFGVQKMVPQPEVEHARIKNSDLNNAIVSKRKEKNISISVFSDQQSFDPT